MWLTLQGTVCHCGEVQATVAGSHTVTKSSECTLLPSSLLTQSRVPAQEWCHPQWVDVFHLSPSTHAKRPAFSGDFYNFQLDTAHRRGRRYQLKSRTRHSSPLEFILQVQLSSMKEKGCTQDKGTVARGTQGKKSFGGSPSGHQLIH